MENLDEVLRVLFEAIDGVFDTYFPSLDKPTIGEHQSTWVPKVKRLLTELNNLKEK